MTKVSVLVSLALLAGCAVYPTYPSAGVTVSPYGVHPYFNPGGVYVTPQLPPLRNHWHRRHWW
jgi:hypothetical protein